MKISSILQFLFDKFMGYDTLKPYDDAYGLENYIIDICGDGCDGLSEEAIHSLVKHIYGNLYSTDHINVAIDILLNKGKIITDGHHFIDPIMCPNTAKRVLAGERII